MTSRSTSRSSHTHDHSHDDGNHSSSLSSNSSTFDVKDDRYRVTKEFLPNKTFWWRRNIIQQGNTTTMTTTLHNNNNSFEDDHWYLGNTIIRNEIHDLIQCIKSIINRNVMISNPSTSVGRSGSSGGHSGEASWCIEYLQQVFDMIEANVKLQHEIKDTVLIPFYKKRFNLGSNYYEEMISNHIKIEEQLKLISYKIHGIARYASSGASSSYNTTNLLLMQLNQTMEEIGKLQKQLLEPTLSKEEQNLIPFIRAYFTPTDIQTLYQRVLTKSATKTLIGSFIYNMKRHQTTRNSDDDDGELLLFGVEYFKNVYMKHENISNIVWYIHFQSNYEYYEREFVYKVKSIQRGRIVQPPRRKTNIFMSGPVTLVAMVFVLIILVGVIFASSGDHAISRFMNGMLFGGRSTPIKNHHHHHHHHHGYYHQQNGNHPETTSTPNTGKLPLLHGM